MRPVTDMPQETADVLDLMGRILEQPAAKELAAEVARDGSEKRRRLVASLADAKRGAVLARAEVGRLTQTTAARLAAAEDAYMAARDAHARGQVEEWTRISEIDGAVVGIRGELEASADQRIGVLMKAINGASRDLMSRPVYSAESNVSPEGRVMVGAVFTHSNAAAHVEALKLLSECHAEAEALLYSDLESDQVEQALYRIARKAGIEPLSASSDEPWYRRALRAMRGQRA
jgi:hypothetical protein